MTGTLTERMLPAPVGGGFSMEGYWVWCGSVIRAEDGRYHLFASRWPRHLPMHPGWMMASEVVRAVSDTPAGPYRFEEIVLPARGAQYWDGRATHNPHITRCRGRYYLYYTGITHPFSDPVPGQPLTTDDCRVIAARASKRVGVAVADRITGPWRRSDQPVLTTRSINTILNKLRKVSREEGILMLDKATNRNWLTVFPLDEDERPSRFQTPVDDARRGRCL